VLSDEIDNAPTTIALLDMRESERRHLRSPQPAPEKDGYIRREEIVLRFQLILLQAEKHLDEIRDSAIAKRFMHAGRT